MCNLYPIINATFILFICFYLLYYLPKDHIIYQHIKWMKLSLLGSYLIITYFL